MTTQNASLPLTTDAAGAAARARAQQSGLIFGLLAYGWWGIVTPGYFWLVRDVSPEILLGHRMLWGVPCLLVLLTLRSGWSAFRRAWTGGTLGVLIASTICIAINWFFFIYAIVNGRAIEASLGYYINPLFSVALGMVVLGERLRPAQWIAVIVAALGVAWYTVAYGSLPWISLTLAFSFGLYGLLRKRAAVDATVGLAVEMTIVSPLALIYFIYHVATGGAAFGDGSPGMVILLVLAGLVTVVPLLFFVGAARRLRIVTVGFLQYLAPTGQLLMAVYVFGEALDRNLWITMGMIWLALAVFSVDSARSQFGRGA